MIGSRRFVLMLVVSGLGAFAYAGCGADDVSPATTSTPEAGVVTPPVTDSGTTPVADAGPRSCGTKTLCADNCVDTQLDRENCGGCAKPCGPSEVCSLGTCGLSCGGGTTLCGANCADTKTDDKNCGKCGTVCGASQHCEAGGDGGAAACVCNDSIDLQTDDNNCGVCGTVCAAGLECVAGACKGAVSTWLFEDNLDDVSAKNNGTADGTITYGTPSWSQNAGKALILDNTNSVAVAAPADLPVGTSPRTIEAWVRATAFSTATYNGILSYGVRAPGTGQLLSMRSNYQVTSANWNNDLLQTQGPLAAQAWSHVAFTWDGNNRALYIDGQPVATDSPVPFDTMAGELRIGSTDLPGRRFIGWVDDVKVYDYARTPAQLRKTVSQNVHYAFTAATDTTDSGPNKTSAGTKSAAGITNVADRKAAASSAIAFDGAATTQLQIFPVSALGKNRPYTVSVWVNPTTATGTLVHTSSAEAGNGWCIGMLGLNAASQPVATSWDGGPVSVTSDDAIAAGAWTHLATSFSHGSLKLYVNGILKKTVAQASFSASSAPMYVTLGHAISPGCSGAALMPGDYAGAMDDFKVWDRELSAAEIADQAK